MAFPAFLLTLAAPDAPTDVALTPPAPPPVGPDVPDVLVPEVAILVVEAPLVPEAPADGDDGFNPLATLPPSDAGDGPGLPVPSGSVPAELGLLMVGCMLPLLPGDEATAAADDEGAAFDVGG